MPEVRGGSGNTEDHALQDSPVAALRLLRRQSLRRERIRAIEGVAGQATNPREDKTCDRPVRRSRNRLP